MSHQSLKAAAQALADRLPRFGSLAHATYHAKDELDALRAELERPQQPNLIALVVKDFDRTDLHGGAAS